MPMDTESNALLDAHRFIINSKPVVGEKPLNPYGVNNVDSDVYET